MRPRFRLINGTKKRNLFINFNPIPIPGSPFELFFPPIENEFSENKKLKNQEKMAFSSLYQSYIQGAEMPVGRQRDDGALKRYESVEDHRAWSMDGLERSKFIHDIIKRQPTLNLTDATSRIGLTSKNDFAEKIKNLMLEIKVCFVFQTFRIVSNFTFAEKRRRTR